MVTMLLDCKSDVSAARTVTKLQATHVAGTLWQHTYPSIKLCNVLLLNQCINFSTEPQTEQISRDSIAYAVTCIDMSQLTVKAS